MGLLYHVAYLEYFEVARSDWIRQIWKSYREIEDEGYALVVIEAELKYLKPAQYDQLLQVELDVPDWGRSSIVFTYAIRGKDDGELKCTGRTAHCFISTDGKPVRMPGKFQELLQKLFPSEHH